MTRFYHLLLSLLLTSVVAAIPCVSAQAQSRTTAKPAATKSTPKGTAAASDSPVLLGQFGDWGVYQATPGGKKVCFALAKPASAVTDPPGRNRDEPYLFVSTRPAENVKNEISVIVGYPQKPNVDATATVGSANYALYTQNDGAWIRNAADEAQMIDAMRKGSEVVVKSISTHGTKTTDTYSLKGISQALDKVAEACK
ncbi:MAG TPA: invasion associated locus B family protein [Pseudolabrys sp.]|nr:invasion associated locus B family protein [Pseudolabrys sp.]